VTKNVGERYELKCWLEDICKKHSICFIDPVKNLLIKYNNIDNLFLEEKSLNHYNDLGHKYIQSIYKDFIENI